MRVEILGSSAGGGFPQWNCACPNCRSLRAGTFNGKPRTQTQVAVSADNHAWFLLNASPDLRLQIEATPALHPRDGVRTSPIAGVVLTSPDLDQIAGLLSLRELQPFRIYCTPSLRHLLCEANCIFRMLNRIPSQVVWTDIHPGRNFSLTALSGEDSGLTGEPFSLGGRYPAYATAHASSLASDEAALGLTIASSHARLAYLPAVPAIDAGLLERMNTADALLFDGTFWTDDELKKIQGSGATASEMGHMPVSLSMPLLAGLHRPRKIFAHVNNTNPMLNQSSPEYLQVRAAGWEIAEDGWRIDL